MRRTGRVGEASGQKEVPSAVTGDRPVTAWSGEGREGGKQGVRCFGGDRWVCS
jgi:hypothetical protein